MFAQVTASARSVVRASFVIAFIALLGMGAAVWGQTSGTILGTITDPSGKVIVGAQARVINEGTGEERTGVTDVTGTFVFVSLLPGRYTVQVESPAFQKFEQKGNVLTATERLSLGTIKLTIGSVTSTVSVTAEGASVQIASSESSALLTSKQLDTIAQKGRVLANYLLLLPGVNTSGGTSDAASGFLTQPAMGGLPNTMMTMSIDGMQGQDLGSQQLFTLSISPDAVEEVKVLMNNYQAEYGRNGGATVNIVTKSGGKDFHGSAYYFKRHEMFNANTFFNNRSGLAKGKYRYNTRGAAIGGPVMIPGLFNRSREKLFFFYNYDDNPSTSTPATPQRQYLPTQAERNGDFSDSRQANGALIIVRDPLNKNAAGVGEPFPGNVIPANRINQHGRTMLNFFPLPNQLNRAITLGAYNNEFLNVVPNVRPGHVFRVDYRPNDKDTIFFRGTITKFQSIRSSLANFDWADNSFSALNKTGSLGWTRVVTPSMVNEFTFGARRPLEVTRIDDDRAFRKTYNLTVGQFHPEINYDDLVPLTSYSGGGLPGVGGFGNFQAGRFPQNEADILLFVQDGFTITRNKHTFKFGIYAEKDRISTGSGFQTLPYGSFDFRVDANFPDDSKHPFGNALLGNFYSYSESQVRTRPAGVAINVDWYVQDAWRVTKKLTLELGLRSAYFSHWWGWHGTSTSFSLERYNPSQAPVMYRPAIVNGARVAVNPLTGQTASNVLLLGPAFVPGTGDPGNGSLTSADKSYPRGFIQNVRQLPQPRFGFAYDVFGNSKTAIRGGFGVQNQLLRYEPQAAGAPISYTPVYYFGNLNTYLNLSGFLSPGTVTGHQKDRPTPRIYNVSLGVQQDVGFNSILDVKYVGTLARNLGTTRAINTIPYSARFTNLDTTQSGNTPLNDNYLRPYPGWAGITNREAGGSSNYHSLQVAMNRRFARVLHYGMAYTYSKAMDYGGSMPIYRNAREFNYGKSGTDQTHILTVNYTYEVPSLSRKFDSRLIHYVFDNWEVSGITSFSSGTPSDVTFGTTDGFDFYGGGDGGRIVITGDPKIGRSERTELRMFNTSVFARPAGRGDYGNVGRGIVRGPGINNWDFTLFKRFPLKKEGRELEFRWEFYNLFNHTQFDQIDTSAQFNPAGQQTDTLFGQATRTRAGRIMQAGLRVRF